MLDLFTGWARLMATGAQASRTGLRTVEALNAAGAVIAARTGIIDAAMRAPLTADHKELNRMVPEKVEAFSRAGIETANAWWAGQSAWMGQMQHLGTMAMRGRLPSAAEMVDLGDRTATLALESIEATTRLGAATLAPVHRSVTANARRLKRKPSGKR